MRKTVCLVGSPNTGKSTLFNRLLNEKKAITSDIAGTTRDRLYGVCYHNDKSFTVIDTGGIDLENASFMFSVCRSINELKLPEFWKYPKIKMHMNRTLQFYNYEQCYAHKKN